MPGHGYLHCPYPLYLHQAAARGKRTERCHRSTFLLGDLPINRRIYGSFKIRKETAKALLFDILASLADFGFKTIVGINAHGDIEQNIVVVEAFKGASKELGITACYPFPQGTLHHYGLTGSEPYICQINPQTIQVSQSQYPDVHAGDIETATMHHFYPHLTDAQKARSLPPVEVEDDKIMAWLFGGHTKELSPAGYLGAPADFGRVDVIKNISDIADRISEAILERIGKE